MVLPRFSLALILALGAGLTACGEKETTVVPIEPKLPAKATIAILSTQSSASLRKSFEDYAAEKNDVELIFEPLSEDAEARRAQISRLAGQQVAALALSGGEETDLSPAVQMANELGMPIVVFGMPDRDVSGEVVCQIRPDAFISGQLAGRSMIEAIGETGGRLVALRHETSGVTEERLRGIRDQFSRFNQSRLEHPIELVAATTAEEAVDALSDIDGLLALGEGDAFTALKVLENRGQQDRVAIVGFGRDPDSLAASASGRIYGVVSPIETELARETLSTIRRHLAEFEIPATVTAPVELR